MRSRRGDCREQSDARQPVTTRLTAFGPLPFLSGSTSKRDALAFVQRLQPRAFDRRDVDEHVASAIVRLDEAVTALAVEEFDRTGHCHRETPSPWLLRRRPPRLDGSAGHSQTGKASAGTGLGHSAGLPKEVERQSPAQRLTYVAPLERGQTWAGRIFADDPFDRCSTRRARATDLREAATRTASSAASRQGGLTTTSPASQLNRDRISPPRSRQLDAQDLWPMPAPAQFACEVVRPAPVLDRVPQQVDAGRPFALGRDDRRATRCEFVLLLERRIDHHDPTPLARRQDRHSTPPIRRCATALARRSRAECAFKRRMAAGSSSQAIRRSCGRIRRSASSGEPG